MIYSIYIYIISIRYIGYDMHQIFQELDGYWISISRYINRIQDILIVMISIGSKGREILIVNGGGFFHMHGK